MPRNLYILFVIISSLFLMSCNHDNDVDRIDEFYNNLFAGRIMQPEDWLTEEARSSRLFNSFGGLQALIKGSAAEAAEEGGVKSIKVRIVNRGRGLIKVEVIAELNSNKTFTSTDYWANKEGGRWKLTVGPGDHPDDFAP